MSQSDRFGPPGGLGRNVAIAGSVVVLHAATLWAMQHGLLQRAPEEVIVPAQVIAEFISPPAPEPEAPKPPPPPPPPPKPQPVVKKAPPLPKAIADPKPAPAAPRGTLEDEPKPVVEAPPAPPAPPKIELPSNNAAYLNNPAPNYPAISRRMGEQGTVMLRIFVDAQGLPQKIEVSKSSGYDRLDQQAVDGVKNWKFVPGKSNGTPTPMWVTVPVKFTLN